MRYEINLSTMFLAHADRKPTSEALTPDSYRSNSLRRFATVFADTPSFSPISVFDNPFDFSLLTSSKNRSENISSLAWTEYGSAWYVAN